MLKRIAPAVAPASGAALKVIFALFLWTSYAYKIWEFEYIVEKLDFQILMIYVFFPRKNIDCDSKTTG